jgi:hypothetical protein
MADSPGRPAHCRSLGTSLTGDLQYEDGFNANRIEASPDGRTLLVIQSNTGELVTVSTTTGVTKEVDLRGADPLTNGGRPVAPRLDPARRSQPGQSDRGRPARSVLPLGHAHPDDHRRELPRRHRPAGPLRRADDGRRIRSIPVAVNARFGTTTPTSDTRYTVVRVSAR